MSSPQPPRRSRQQMLDALGRANEVRAARARLKRDLKSGRCVIAAVLLAQPEYVQTMKVFDLLLAAPKYGRVKVNKTLTQCRIAPSKTVGALTERQRSELIGLLRRQPGERHGMQQHAAGRPMTASLVRPATARPQCIAPVVGQDRVAERSRPAASALVGG